MNRNISDLLDDIQVDSVNLNPVTAGNIKEITMRKLHETARYRTVRLRKVFGGVAIAAVLFATSATAIAANVFGIGDYFKSVFGVMSESQLAVLEEIGKTDMPSVTSNGTTITPLAAIGDDDYYYLMLRIVAPEGTVLNFDSDDTIIHSFALTTKAIQFSNPDDPDNSISLEFGSDQYNRTGRLLEIIRLEDDDPGDNIYVCTLRYTAQYSSDFKFNDGIPKTLRIKGIWSQSADKVYTKILDGDWAFDIGDFGASGSVEVNTDGIYIVAGNDYSTEMELKYLYVSPLGIRFDYTYDYQNVDQSAPGIGLTKVVMKDGSTVEVFASDGYANETSSGYHGYFAQPVKVSEIDYLQFWSYRIKVN
jgi:hypothetical protein